MLLAHDYNSRRSSIASSTSRNIRITVLKNMFKKMALTRSALKKALVVLFISALVSCLLLLYWNDSSESPKPSTSMSMGIYNTHIYGSAESTMAGGDSLRTSAIPVNPIERSWTYKCVNNRCVRHHFVDGVEEDFDTNAHQQQSPQQQSHGGPLGSGGSSSSSSSTNSGSSSGKRIPHLTCAMTCGPINIWPQPTGATTIGSKTSRFRLSDMHVKIVTRFEPVEKLLHEAYDVMRSEIRGVMVAHGASLEEIEGALPAGTVPVGLQPSATEQRPMATEVNDAATAGRRPSTVDAGVGKIHFFKLVSDKRYDVDAFEVNVHVEKSADTHLTLHTDESYNMTVTHSARVLIVKISANTFFGAKHGLTTLQQLIWFDDEERTLKVLNKASIEDVPKFNYRGLMLDTSRHYFSVDSIKRTLVGMSHSKLNRFHWHITDSQSFPLVSKHYPQLARYGAYSEREVYTPDDVRALTAFAKVRGIQIIPEIDAPAHAGNGWDWGPKHGLGELSLCINQQPWNNYCGEPPCGQLNPKNNNTYLILQKLYEELLEIVGPLDYFHIGGDEVNLECWQQHFNDSDMRTLWCDFMQQAYHRLQLASGQNGTAPRMVGVWSSGLTSAPCLSKNTFAVQVWGGSKWPENFQLINSGYSLVISHVDAWYLDCGFGSWRSTGEGACSPYRNWQTVYKHRPWEEMKLTSLQMRQILGGEACLWTEQVDESLLDTRLWPRASALAERLWTDPTEERYSESVPLEVYNRMSVFRNHLLELGLRAEPIFPKYCGQNQDECV